MVRCHSQNATLIKYCNSAGPLYDAGQVGIEVAVPQPEGYKKSAVRRDLVIWEKSASTCWDSQWKPVNHPLAILEWKVRRPGHRNREVRQEREWLRRYCMWQPSVVAYAIEIDTATKPFLLSCARFRGQSEEKSWLILKSDGCLMTDY
jgi:hypothetical protein